ncbi:MAG: ribonuclease III domain-containing protein [Eubacteriales bacterium]
MLLIAYWHLHILGDSVYELMVRTMLSVKADLTNHSMHSETLNYVSADAQFEAYQKIKDILTPYEADIFRRGRNAPCKDDPQEQQIVPSIIQQQGLKPFSAHFGFQEATSV